MLKIPKPYSGSQTSLSSLSKTRNISVMKHQYYGWHWLNIEQGDEVYSYSHGRLHKQTVVHATAYYKTVPFASGRKETYMSYVVYEAVNKNNKKSTFRFDVGTIDMELGYGKDHKGTIRFSRIEAARHYFQEKRKYAQHLVSYYNSMADKNKKIIKSIDRLDFNI